MERGQDEAAAQNANYGAGAVRSGVSFVGVTPTVAVSVHANVDAPFKPLIPFVPTEHWDACNRAPAVYWPDWAGRPARWLAECHVRVAAMVRRVWH